MLETTKATIRDLEFLKTQIDPSLWVYLDLTTKQLVHLENIADELKSYIYDHRQTRITVEE